MTNPEITATDVVNDAEDSAGTTILKALIAEMAQQERPWQAMTEAQQQAVIDRLANQIRELAGDLVKRILTLDYTYVTANIESVTFKDGVKCVLSLSRTPEVFDVAEAQGGYAMLIVAEPEAFTKGMHSIRATPDQVDAFGGVELKPLNTLPEGNA